MAPMVGELLRLQAHQVERDCYFIDNLLVRVHFIIVMIRWTGLATWESELHFPGSLTTAFLNLRTKRSGKSMVNL